MTPPNDPALRQGLFAEAASYPALVRFSSGLLDNDREADARGMAIKLADVPGPVCEGAPPGQQDFILVDQPRAPARDAAEAEALFGTLDGVGPLTLLKVAAPRFLMPGMRPWRLNLNYLALLLRTGWDHLVAGDLSRRTYHSVTPYGLGEGVMKFACRPDPANLGRPRPRGANLAEKLAASLAAGPLAWEFLIQPRQGEADRVDLAGQRWSGPLVVAARLEIPPQPVLGTAALGDGLAFNPGNALLAHAPIGPTNVLRREIYGASAADRGASGVFPTSFRGAPGR